MGKVVIEKWQCDRCMVIFDNKPPYNMNATRYTVRINADYGVAGGPMMCWDEMCAACNREVGELLEMLKPSKVAK